jgi:predicted RNA-binding Zn-ribbon protein involved in translation (DUF1610 family)
MSGEVTCPKCGQQVVIPAPPEVVWVNCPRCGERLVNQAALNTGAPAPLSCLVGLVFALCATMSFLFAAAVLALLAGLAVLLGFVPLPVTKEGPLMIVVGSLGCLAYGLLLYAGGLLSRAETAREGRSIRIVAGVSALVLSGMVVAVLAFLINHVGR